MSFRDEMAADLDGVFFDAEEFASEHTVEGRTIRCVLDTSRSQAKSDGAEYDLAAADYVLIAKTADLPRRKSAGALLRLDGRDLTVAAWHAEDAMTTVELYAPETA